MKIIELDCTYCKNKFTRSLKSYNGSKRKGGENYKPFCNSRCAALYASSKSVSKQGLASSEKRCTKCLNIKDALSDFSLRATWCKLCCSLFQKQYRSVHKLTDEQKKIRSIYSKRWRSLNKQKVNLVNSSYYKSNRNRLKTIRSNYYRLNKNRINKQNNLYYIENKDKVLEHQKVYKNQNQDKVRLSKTTSEKRRINSNPLLKLRKRVSSQIREQLKRFGSSKSGKSIVNYLDYSISDLRIHLENLFEPWMAWDNYGSYNKDEWDDNDKSTWKWNIDHIIPQSKLPYISMEDDNFKKCWSLINLRPLSAKQNLLDGVNNTR